MLTIEFKNSIDVERNIKFQEGTIVTLRAIRGLQNYLRENLGLPYLLTSHVDQNYQESLHGQLKGGRGGVSRPTALAFNYRIARKIYIHTALLIHFLLKLNSQQYKKYSSSFFG